MRKVILGMLLSIFIFNGVLIGQEIKDGMMMVKTNSEDIVILYKDQPYPWKIVSENLSFPYDKDGSEIGLITSDDTLTFFLVPNDSLRIDFIINGVDTVKAIAIGQPKSVDYSSEYINKYKGKYQVLAPDVHELVNICIALTDIGRLDSNMVYMNSDYYRKVMNHFDQFRNLKVINELNKNITEIFGAETYNYYYNIRMNACMYTFDNNQIVNNSPYNRLSFSSSNQLHELLPSLRSFAEQSNFHQFYTSNLEYYNSLVTAYHELVPVHKMWKWLEEKFPLKYDSYKIYFSPLIGGAHSTKSYLEGPFKETIMFIDAPIFKNQLGNKEKEAILSRIIFTEIDHNYVNPTTDNFAEIGSLLTPLEYWNDGTQGYENSYSTFNEYMTYAIFTLYLFDHFEKDLFEVRNKIESTFMTDNRGFIKFKEFNQFVLDWYIGNPDKQLTELYPELIYWIKNQ